MSVPHMTVVIPTRDRADVFRWSLQTALQQTYPNMTILVSDNLSDGRTAEIVKEANDPRIRYVNTGRRLSMTGNYEFALSHVEEGWVTIVGDDDGLLPEALFRVAEIIKATGVDAVRSDVCLYRWPSLMQSEFGTLSVPLNGEDFEIRTSSEWLSRVMSGRARYPNLPMLYSGGFVNTAVINDLRKRRGSFYHSSIPDVYSAMALASVLDKYAYAFRPFAIDGVSKHSIGTSLVGKTPDSSAVKKFFTEENLPWHPSVPADAEGRVPRVHQAWLYESYLQSGFLRNGWEVTSPLHQIEVTISDPDIDPVGMEWAKQLASMNGLDFEAIVRGQTFSRLKRKMNKQLMRSSKAAKTYYIIGDRENPVSNVFEASLAAGDLLERRPGTGEVLGRLAQKALHKIAS
jgi:glycosyltransferase involved in cell wall biosynthesis